MEILKFRLVNGPFSDATSIYTVEFPKDILLKDLVNTILERKEWGYIRIREDDNPWINQPKVEYSRAGQIIDGKFKDKDLSKTVVSIQASGGWSRMDYFVTLRRD